MTSARSAVGPAQASAAEAAGRATSADAVVAEAFLDGPPDAVPDEAPRLPPLTARQTEIARLVADGLTNKAPAARLHLAESTVERHLVNIFRTLGIGSRARLAAWVAAPSAGVRPAPPPVPG